MNKKRILRLTLLWSATIGMGGIVGMLLYIQMSVHQDNVVTSLEVPAPEVTDDNETFFQVPETDISRTVNSGQTETAVAAESGPYEKKLAELPADTDFSHLVETDAPYWKVTLFSDSGISTENWHTILVQNRFKIDYTLTPLAPRDWQLNQKNKSIRIQFRSESGARKDILARKKRGKYSIQLISIEDHRFLLAVSLIRRLLNDGHYAYLHRTDAEFDGKYRYRVRVGFFKNIEDARAIGKEIYEKYRDEDWFSPKYWPVQPGPQELSRPVIDLRQPLNKPWVIQLPSYSKKESALKDLSKFNIETDFSYLSQKLNSATGGKLGYRIRIGFFETKKEAGEALYKLRKKFALFKKAKTIHL